MSEFHRKIVLALIWGASLTGGVVIGGQLHIIFIRWAIAGCLQ